MIRSPAALPRMAVRGRAFLSEQSDDNPFRYNKGGLAPKARNPPAEFAVSPDGGLRRFAPNPPYEMKEKLDGRDKSGHDE